MSQTDLRVRAPVADQARLEAAGEWLQRLDESTLDDKELQMWLEWFGASDANVRAFDELQTLRRQLRELPPAYREELRLKRVRARAVRTSRRVALAAAATLAAVAVAVGAWRVSTTAPVSAIYAAPPEHHRTIDLVDGSALVVGADSIVAIRFDAKQRQVNIERGSAYFEVEHDATRPFVVHASGVQVKAVGTAFRVSRSPKDVTVTVTDGVVEVARPPRTEVAEGAHPRTAVDEDRGGDVHGAAEARHHLGDRVLRVSVGQRTVIETRVVEQTITEGDHSSTEQWRDGQVHFVNAPLSEVLRVINQLSDINVVIDDPRVEDFAYSGTIMQAHLDEWIASLPQIYPIRAVPLDDGSITLVSASRR